MFYDKFTSLCQAKGVTKTQAAAEIGFDRSSITKWKTKGFAPRRELLIKIADYFGVTVDSLLGNEKEKMGDEELKFALFGESKEITDEMMNEVKEFARFVKMKYRKD